MSEKLYQDELMEIFKYPKNKQELENPDIASLLHNPSCGDKVSIQVKFYKDKNGILKVEKMAFMGSGCVISQASASLLTEFCKDKTIEQLQNISTQDILDLIKIKLGPTRMRCALLALDALKSGLKKYL